MKIDLANGGRPCMGGEHQRQADSCLLQDIGVLLESQFAQRDDFATVMKIDVAVLFTN